MESISGVRIVILALAILQFFIGQPSAIAWEPTKPIEFIIPAGTGGGADQMARLIAVIAEKHKFSPRPPLIKREIDPPPACLFPSRPSCVRHQTTTLPVGLRGILR